MDNKLDQKRTDTQADNGMTHGEIPAFLKRDNPALDMFAQKIEDAAKALATEAQKADAENTVAQAEPDITAGQISFLKNYAKTVFNKATNNEELTADDRFKLRVAVEADRRVQAGEANATRYTYYKVYRQLRAEETEREANLLKAMEAELSATFEVPANTVEPVTVAATTEPASEQVEATTDSEFILDEKAFEEALAQDLDADPEIATKPSTALVPFAVQQAAKETVAEQAGANDNKDRRGFSFLRAVTSLGHGVMAVAVLAAALTLGAMANFTPDEIKTAYNDGANYLSQVFEGDSNTRLATNEDGSTIVRTQTVTIDADGNYVFADTAATPADNNTAVAETPVETPADTAVESSPVETPAQPSPIDEFAALDTADQIAVIEMMIADGVQGDLIKQSIEIATQGANETQTNTLGEMAANAGVTLTPAETTVAEATVEIPAETAAEVTAEATTPATPAEETVEATEAAPVTETAPVAETTVTEVGFETLSKDEQIAQIGAQIASLDSAEGASRDVLAQVINQNILVASAGVTDEAHVNALADFQNTMGWTSEEVTTVAVIPTTADTPTTTEVAAETPATDATTDTTVETAPVTETAPAATVTTDDVTLANAADMIRDFYTAHNATISPTMEAQLSKLSTTSPTGHAEMGAFDAGKLLVNEFRTQAAADLTSQLWGAAAEGQGRASRLADQALDSGEWFKTRYNLELKR